MVKITKGSNKKLNPWEAKSLISLHKAWQIERSDKHCVPMTESHSTVLQKVSAPNAWVPLLLCPKVQCSYGCAPNAVHLVPASVALCANSFNHKPYSIETMTDYLGLDKRSAADKSIGGRTSTDQNHPEIKTLHFSCSKFGQSIQD